ncbi:unnamed protein product [Diatraea saccharalis]|uniref:Major facilitator superfamily (MFS) profile domain-containing protein n=1 Tax=Diatraea saccharalis TaxID=40085 RepID=A0A9N9WEI2_9NEOP|nr:unnamed protein product [Diatraea saccharalis]
MVSKEPLKTKMPEQMDNQFNLEGLLSELGSFGKYQLLLLFLLAFRDSFLAMCNYNYVFTAAEVDYRCYVPECESSDVRFNVSFAQFALANHSDICHRVAPRINDSNLSNSDDECAPEGFIAGETVPCDRIIYQDYNSIFDLGCQPWKRTLIGTVHNLGLVFSFLLSGFISDRYGRKIIIVATPLVVGIVGLVKSFSVNYWMLLVLEFLETALGYGNASMVLSLEMVTQKRRVIFSCVSDILSNFGFAFFGLIAWKIPYWRHMMWVIYAPLLVVVFYIFLVDEGVRWLLAHNKKDEAVRVLNKVAKINNITLSKKANEMLTNITEEARKTERLGQNVPQSTHIGLLVVLRSKKILLRVFLIAAIFFCCIFVYNGCMINSTSIVGNKYLNFSSLVLVTIPTRIITAITLTKFGRKAPICVAYILCCVFFIASAYVPKSIWWASVVFYLLGKMCSSYGMFSMTVVALEVFPTTSRNSLTNTANTIGRLGAVLAPQTPLLEKYMAGLPSIVFGLVALGPVMLSLLLPDTSHSSLPDHIQDAERIGDTNDTIHKADDAEDRSPAS